MELLRRVRARSEFERFVADCAEDLVRTGYLIVWDLAEAEDLVQDCLLRVARRWSRVRKMENPRAYARRILVNLALDGSARRSRRKQELQQPDAPASEAHALEIDAAEQIARLEIGAELRQAMKGLPVRQRTMLVLRYFEDLSESQVAGLLGCSTGNVKSSTARALERLRAELGPDYQHDNTVAPMEKEKAG